MAGSGDLRWVDSRVSELFARVREAIAGATATLLEQDSAKAKRVIDQDHVIDAQVVALEQLIWNRLEAGGLGRGELQLMVGVLQLLPELERSADLAEHIAQRAMSGLGGEITPLSRGIVQRMADVACAMWRRAADAYAERISQAASLDEDDEELDILHERLLREIDQGRMSPAAAAQLTLVGRFYERLGDHAVNVARRIEHFVSKAATSE